MPLFKKIIFTIFLILLFLIGLYYVLFSYVKDEVTYKITDYKEIINICLPKIKEIFVYLYDSFINTIVYVFSFSYKDMPNDVATYFIFVGITGLPSVFFFMRFLTYRGMKAIKLTIKKAKANPNYYDDWRKSIKISTYDNIDEPLPFGVQCIIFTFRIILMILMIIILPILMLFILLLELIGILKGVTNTGRVNDFD